MKVKEFSTLDNPESWYLEDDTVIEFHSPGDACLAQELFVDLLTRERMLSSQCGELAVSLRACEKQLVSCAHAYRRVSNFDEAQRCSNIAMQARLVLKKWEEL